MGLMEPLCTLASGTLSLHTEFPTSTVVTTVNNTSVCMVVLMPWVGPEPTAVISHS